MRRLIRFRPALRLALAWPLLAALPAVLPRAATAAEQVGFVLNWVAGGDHAPLYFAREKGWYAAEGIDLAIETGKGSIASVQQVGIGKTPFGIADLPTAMIGIGQGAKLVAVFAIYENSPYAIYWLKSSGIKSLKDLAGRTIGNPPGDATRVMWPALAAPNGLAADAIRWVNITPQGKVAALKSRAVDAVTDFYNAQDQKIRELGDDMGYLSFRETGLNPYGNSIVVNQDYLAAHRDTVARLVRVTQRAYAACVADGKPCIDALLRASSGLQEQDQLDQWQRVKELMNDDYARQTALGGFDPARVAKDYALVETYFKLEHEFPVASAYSNAFLDPAVKMPAPR